MARICLTGKNDPAVSPVVGVMLMLVVTIIIAAVVSGFAGNLIGSSVAKKTPSLNMDVKIINTGDWHGSGFFATVTSVSDPIPTKDLKIVTSWTGQKLWNNRNPPGMTTCNEATLYRGGNSFVGPTLTGGNTVLPFNGTSNINVLYDPTVPLGQVYNAPFGNGPGVNGTESTDSSNWSFSLPGQQFGNFTLMQGTTMTAIPCGAADVGSIGSGGQSNGNWGYIRVTKITDAKISICANVYRGTKYTSCPQSICIDPTEAILGKDWHNLVWGNSVNVKVIYTPTGSVIFNKDIPVTES